MMVHAQSVSAVSAAPFITDNNNSNTDSDNYLSSRSTNFHSNASSDAIAPMQTSSSSPSLAPSFEHQPQAKRQRYSSQSNSISGSSSVTTVHRVASRSSSRTGAPGNAHSTRPQSPNDTSSTFVRQSNGSAVQSGASQQYQKHSTFGPHDQHTNGNSTDPSFQRWSQSTGSSKSSSKQYQRGSSTAMPASSSSRHPSGHAAEYQSTSRPASRPGSRQRPLSPLDSPERSRALHMRPGSRGNPLNALPVLQTRALKYDAESDSPSTASTGAIGSAEAITPNTFSSDHFASSSDSPRNVAKNARPSTARTSTTPIMSLNYSRMPRAEDVKESVHYRRRSEHLSNLGSQNPRASTANPASAVEEKKDRSSKPKDRGEREKKTMLAKALEKANIAVVLDNKQDFLGAFDAYTEACMLLQQVMDRSVNPADQKKLEAIKVTYTNRIEELKLLEAAQDDAMSDGALAERPLSNDSLQEPTSPYSRGSASIATAREARLVDVPRLAYPEKDRDSFFSRTMADVDRAARNTDDLSFAHLNKPTPAEPIYEAEDTATQGRPHIVNQRVSKLPPPEETRYLPAPLATRKSPSPTSPIFNEETFTNPADQHTSATKVHGDTDGEEGNGSGSWLDTIAESSASSARSSSVHSVSSQQGVRRKPLPAHHVRSNPDLDAAFDAAVEAAYDEGLEPDLDTPQPSAVPNALPGASSAADVKKVVSPTAEAPGRRDMPSQVQGPSTEDDEEERILDEFTHDYGHGFNFAFGTKSALPRQSDSSGYSRSTWQSSQASERATAGTSLSTVAENDLGLRISTTGKTPLPNASPISPVDVDNLPPSVPPPNMALPTPPKPDQLSGSTVRKRRFSGQNAKDLKIEVLTDATGRKRASTLHHNQQAYLSPAPDYDTDTHKEVTIGAPLELTKSEVNHERMLKSPPSLDMLSSAHRVITPTDTIRSADDTALSGSLHMRPGVMMKKNQSSLSLRGDHTVLLPSPSLNDPSEPTPYSAMFAPNKSKFSRDPLHSQRAESQSFASPLTISSLPAGVYLFDTKLLANRGAFSPRVSSADAPLALEPCPESVLLRPFWVMRSIGSTITNPRGGFVTNKLFVPREAWQTRGVKLKNIEDKVANCDLLTAALGQLSEVDTFDADAVMDELQRFEEVMERVQAALVKKLGSEVGVHGLAALFKDAQPAGSSSATTYDSDRGDVATDKNAKSNSAKGYLSSWRKLRSKSSGAAISHTSIAAHKNGMIGSTGDKGANTMLSVPMTSFVPVERRGQKRDLRQLSFDGPNKEYMGSLARLFQGVQVLDQIARQVEDPGLKHSSETHVGLELSIRHAAEFFSFYICRFVLADLGVLVDKFVKRGTEWVMA